MEKRQSTLLFLFLLFCQASFGQELNPLAPDPNPAPEMPGMKLVWADEFNNNGKPNPDYWNFEKGFVRNQELQWYQENNAMCSGGVLLIEGRKEVISNPNYLPESSNWKTNREFAHYTSSSINTRGQKQWLYGRFEIRARIDTSLGAWPAIWTLGTTNRWPSNGEIDIMEYYRSDSVPTILANVAWGTNQPNVAKWHTEKIRFSQFTAKDSAWVQKFHIWRMDWTSESIKLYLDDVLLNTTLLSETINPDRSNPFKQPQYILLNLALGRNGGDPAKTIFPIKYEVDYVRVYQMVEK